MGSVLLCTGMSVRVWRRANSVKLVKILQPLKRITRRWALRQQRAREKKKAMETNSEAFTHTFVRARLHLFYFLCFCHRARSPQQERSGITLCRLRRLLLQAQGESGRQTALRNASASLFGDCADYCCRHKGKAAVLPLNTSETFKFW